jgi:hypothetical protein
VSEIADKLREARALIERGWTQGEYARRKDGAPASILSRELFCYCAAGAVAAGAGYKYPSSIVPGMRELSLAVGGDGDESDILNWNDAPERTQAEVLAAFDKAIELAEQSA